MVMMSYDNDEKKNKFVPLLCLQSLLSHVDLLIYLDADTIVVSSLKDFWDLARKESSAEVLAWMSSNTESSAQGHYTIRSKVPYYGDRGE